MGAGRFVCVALPFGLTLGSLICILIAMLAGVTNKTLYLFNVETQNFSASASSLTNIVDEVLRRDVGLANIVDTTQAAASANNITTADLGLADAYKVSLWNYCAQNGTNYNCSSPHFNWAASSLNVSEIESRASTQAGSNVTLPIEMTKALETFATVSRWTQIVYLIALISCAIELVIGIFAICSRAGSCLTYLISAVASGSTIIASILATVQSSLVTAAINSAAKAYGVHASINTSFLATTWLAVALASAAGLFWLLSTCCCAADNSRRSRSRAAGVDDQEKLVPTGAYQRVDDGYFPQQQGVFHPYSLPMHSVKPARGNAYEPYSHGAA